MVAMMYVTAVPISCKFIKVCWFFYYSILVVVIVEYRRNQLRTYFKHRQRIDFRRSLLHVVDEFIDSISLHDGIVSFWILIASLNLNLLLGEWRRSSAAFWPTRPPKLQPFGIQLKIFSLSN